MLEAAARAHDVGRGDARTTAQLRAKNALTVSGQMLPGPAVWHQGQQVLVLGWAEVLVGGPPKGRATGAVAQVEIAHGGASWHWLWKVAQLD